MEDCVFCRIIKGEIPCAKIYEDEKIIAFLDISPASEKGGHTLVMPKKHYELFSEINDEDLTALSKVLRKITKALLKFGKGVNIVQNNGKIAGQFVKHTHFHIIPRFENDGITIEKWKPLKYEVGKIEEVASKIKSLL